MIFFNIVRKILTYVSKTFDKKVSIDSFEDFLVDQDRQFHDIDGRRVPNSKTCQFHD